MLPSGLTQDKLTLALLVGPDKQTSLTSFQGQEEPALGLSYPCICELLGNLHPHFLTGEEFLEELCVSGREAELEKLFVSARPICTLLYLMAPLT